MSTERVPFGFNSLIPETYKTKAEAFARCLQHKLLSLGRVESSPDFAGESTKRLNGEKEQDGNESFRYARRNTLPREKSQRSLKENEDEEGRSEASQKFEKTEVDSDEEFSWNSESEVNNTPEQRKEVGARVTKQKLTSMSSEDSTVDSWCSCQDNLTDFEKFDSENEEVNHLASQVRGSPKLRSLSVRLKRKELQEKPWKKKNQKNYSSSTESVDFQFSRQKQATGNQIEKFDSEPHSQYTLLDGLEDDDVPHRVLRESSSTSDLEMHFSRPEEYDFPRQWCQSEKERNAGCCAEMELLTPPSSPDLERKKIPNGEAEIPNRLVAEDREDTMNRLNFAEIATNSDEVEFEEAENVKDFSVDDMSVPCKKMGGVIVECPSDGDSRTDSEWISDVSQCVMTTVQVFEDLVEEEPKESDEELKSSETEKVSIVVEAENTDETDVPKSEDDEIHNSKSKLRRCSSLKTYKTPPGTPGAKKIVRFADALGLDLADVRTYLDDIPKVPSSAFEDLHFDFPAAATPPPPPAPAPTLIPLFQQPGHQLDFLDRVQRQKICLESALVCEVGVLAVTAYIRVLNLSFHKSVHVRYSLNNWETFSDLQATYVPNSCDGFSDKFSFVLYGHTLKIGQRLEFALRLESSGAQFWDNNGGVNYVFDCLPQSSANGFFSSSLYGGQGDSWPEFY